MSLKNHPGFLTLLRLLEVDLQNSEANLAVVKDPIQALRLLRYWQMLRSVIEAFIVAPDKVFQTLELLKNASGLEDPTIPQPNYFAGTSGVPPAKRLPPPTFINRTRQSRSAEVDPNAEV